MQELKRNKINQLLKPLSPEYVGAYMDNTIQIYDLLEWCLLQCPKSYITIVSFSLSEEFIRKIQLLKKQNLIVHVSILLDLKAMQKTEKLLRFSENVFDNVSFAKVHAKIILIQNDTINIAIIGSQNATRTSRTESILVTTCQHVIDNYNTMLLNIQKLCYIPKNKKNK
jgi:phosphatidylserine/phosphatidylglycerophosphate/cardiolipin synthase-like enzyme